MAIDSLNKELTEAEIKLNGALKKNRDNSVGEQLDPSR